MRLALPFLLVLALRASALGGEPAGPEPAAGHAGAVREAPDEGRGGALRETSLRLPLSEVRVIGDERVVLAAGGCSIEGPGFRIEGERLVLWCDPVIERYLVPGGEGGRGGERDERPEPRTAEDWLGPIIHSVYAAGDVHYVRTAERLTVEAERLFVDFLKSRALILRTRMSAPVTRDARGDPIPLVVRAEEVRQVAEREFRAGHASITTCEFEDPDYRLDVDDLRVVGHGEAWDLSTGTNVLRLGSIPVLWLPWLGARSDLSLRPLRSVSFGSRSRFGYELETLWGDEILRGPAEDGTRWGEWNVHLDERTKRGPGVGLDLDYETDLYLGMLRTYYQHDHGDLDLSTGKPVLKEDRGRVWWQQRFDPGEDWRVDLETHLESDGGFRKEFFEREAREDKNPETYGQGRWLRGNLSAFGLVRYRANGHQSQTEYAPRFSGTVISEPLSDSVLGVPGWRLLADVDGAVDRVRRREAGRERETAGWIDRGDFRAALRSPFGLGPVRLSPELAVRLTGFSESADDDEAIGRLAAEGGIRADLTLGRVFPSFRSALLDLEGLRHTVHLDVAYLDRWAVTRDPEELIPHDSVEDLRETQVVTLRMRNFLETRRGRPRRIQDVLDVEIEAEIYPEREVVRNRSVQGLAFVEGRAEAALSEKLSARADVDYDADHGEWLTASTGLRYRPETTWSGFFGYRFIGGQQGLVTTWLDVRPVVRYGLRGYVRYDLRHGSLNRAGILIQRFAHDWILEADLRVNDSLDEVGFQVSIVPRGFGGGPRAGAALLDDDLMSGEEP